MIQEIQSKLIAEILIKEDEFIEKYVRENAIPKIKGKITKGKLKWRGIKLCQFEGNPNGTLKWVTQRGVQISPKIIISINFTI